MLIFNKYLGVIAFVSQSERINVMTYTEAKRAKIAPCTSASACRHKGSDLQSFGQFLKLYVAI